MRPFSKVLVANRGEIAIRDLPRAARARDRLGRGLLGGRPRRAALALRRRGVPARAGPAAESYLDVERILEAARRAGAEAIHPGYGFLAENAAFARAVEDAGPRLDRAAAGGDRADGLEDRGARRRCRRPACRSSPARPSRSSSVEEVAALGEELGYPLLVKAAAGGGGKGMRVVARRDEAERAFASAQREGEAYFADAAVYVERYLEDPRHVEVQVLADAHGNVIHLGERDCTIQRRHQKLIEETPSPAVDAELRERIGQIAVDAARAVGYRSAGTIEGLLAPDGAYYFMEMNTRIQVEHTVTEVVTGLDLVREQMLIAAGEPLSLAAGGRRAARPRDRVPDQRRGRRRRLPARARADHGLPRAGGPRRARRLRRRGGLRDPPSLRPDDREADRPRRRPRARAAADAARARRVRDRRR